MLFEMIIKTYIYPIIRFILFVFSIINNRFNIFLQVPILYG